MTKLRSITQDEITIRIDPLPDTFPPIKPVNTLWAWCTVKVTVTWKDFHAADYLHYSSFENETDFKNSAYYQGMVTQALNTLNMKIEDTYKTLLSLVEP